MDWFTNILGLDAGELKAYQMMARAVVMFFTSFIFLRIAGIRLLGKLSAFDHLTVLMLGAMMGRAIVTSQSFGGTLLAAFTIILLHRIAAVLSYHNKAAGAIFKGEPIALIKDNEEQRPNMKQAHITIHDIMEALRSELNTEDFSKIKNAYLERSGKISIVEK